jgi:hypothetical protein
LLDVIFSILKNSGLFVSSLVPTVIEGILSVYSNYFCFSFLLFPFHSKSSSKLTTLCCLKMIASDFMNNASLLTLKLSQETCNLIVFLIFYICF